VQFPVLERSLNITFHHISPHFPENSLLNVTLWGHFRDICFCCLLYLLQNKTKCIKENCIKMQHLHGNTHLETNDLTEDNKPQKSVKFKVQRRRQRLIVLWNTAKRFSIGKAAQSLGVSRWTVERDLAFLREHELLTPKRSPVAPFELLETGSEFCGRFNAAHRA
jgi:hypothetical protein